MPQKGESNADKIAKLTELRQQGILSEEEYMAAIGRLTGDNVFFHIYF